MFIYREVRLIAAKEIAFVEYEEEPQASIALAGLISNLFFFKCVFYLLNLYLGLNGFKIMKDREILVSYAKV